MRASSRNGLSINRRLWTILKAPRFFTFFFIPKRSNGERINTINSAGTFFLDDTTSKKTQHTFSIYNGAGRYRLEVYLVIFFWYTKRKIIWNFFWWYTLINLNRARAEKKRFNKLKIYEKSFWPQQTTHFSIDTIKWKMCKNKIFENI